MNQALQTGEKPATPVAAKVWQLGDAQHLIPVIHWALGDNQAQPSACGTVRWDFGGNATVRSKNSWLGPWVACRWLMTTGGLIWSTEQNTSGAETQHKMPFSLYYERVLASRHWHPMVKSVKQFSLRKKCSQSQFELWNYGQDRCRAKKTPARYQKLNWTKANTGREVWLL